MMPETKIINRTVFRLSSGIHIERFEDGALVVFVAKHKIVELNTTADEILALIDGKRTLEQVAVEIAENHAILDEDILADVKDLCAELQEWQILEQVIIHSNHSKEEN